MKALLFVGVWLAVGLVVALRRPRAPWERVLCTAFWPFFLAAELETAAPVTAGPIARLQAALPPGDPAQTLVAELATALSRQQIRVARLDGALAEAARQPAGDAALDQARGTSRDLLQAAAVRERAALSDTLAAVEVTATRLWLLRESGDRVEIDALLADLASRLHAGEEVASA